MKLPLRAKAFEAILESTRIMPVSSANVTSVVGWDAAAVDHDSKNDEAQYSDDFDDGQDEFDLPITTDTEYLYADEED